jgi:tetratricopeptide (TPR) repeat protein
MDPVAGSALSLIKAVLELVADRRTGVLDVRSDGVRTQIHFDDGRPVFAEDQAPGESFGRLLMRQGVITNDQFVRVIDEMTRAAAGNNQLRFGEVAVGLSVLTEDQVEPGLAEQVCAIITRSLQRGESQWSFEASPAAAPPPRAFALEVNAAVLEALRQSPDRTAVANVVAARPEELVVVAGPRPASTIREDAGGAADGEGHAARMTAEQTFQKGMALLRDTKTASAAIELRRASELQPESLEYLLYATWARARSYREIPTEADQHALLEVAQRAKTRDPMFAFASYVIGQLSMWAGDEATAKKWFYEALRLDPASEAGKQVRILARRGAGAPSSPAAPEASPAPDGKPPAAAPVIPVGKPAAPAAQSRPPSPAQAPSGGWGRLVPGVALLATVALIIFVVARRSAPQAGLTRVASPPPALSMDAAASTVSEDKEALAAPQAQSDATTEKTADDDPSMATMGTLLLPSRASGHRIFVDGRRVKADGDTPLRLRCGSHIVQIGSGGTAEPIIVPCRGEVQLQ